jgi:hypothetical protein
VLLVYSFKDEDARTEKLNNLPKTTKPAKDGPGSKPRQPGFIQLQALLVQLSDLIL